MKSFLPAVSAVALALGLVGCGGGGGGSTAALVATNDLKADVSSATVLAFSATPFQFGSGVAQLGTAGTPTTLTFSGSNGFSVSTATGSASGTWVKGSCKFTVTASSGFAPGDPLAQINVEIPVSPCQFELDTSGQPAGQTNQVDAFLILGSDPSTRVATTIRIEGSTVFVGSTTLGTITLIESTGGSGGV